MTTVFIDGTPFFAIGHHDGRRIHSAGFFAFARRGWDGRYTVLHLELTDAIHRRADNSHPRWLWALGQGMNELLIHMAGAAADLTGADDPHRQALWHEAATVCMGETTAEEDGRPVIDLVAQRSGEGTAA